MSLSLRTIFVGNEFNFNRIMQTLLYSRETSPGFILSFIFWYLTKYIIVFSDYSVVFFTIIQLCVYDYCFPLGNIVIYGTWTGDEALHYKSLPKL